MARRRRRHRHRPRKGGGGPRLGLILPREEVLLQTNGAVMWWGERGDMIRQPDWGEAPYLLSSALHGEHMLQCPPTQKQLNATAGRRLTQNATANPSVRWKARGCRMTSRWS